MRAAAWIALLLVVGWIAFAGAIAAAAGADATSDPLEHCAEQGGCTIVSMAWLRYQGVERTVSQVHAPGETVLAGHAAALLSTGARRAGVRGSHAPPQTAM